MGYKGIFAKMFKNGLEIPDPTPLELPVNYTHPMSLNEMLGRMGGLSQDLADHGMESLEDAEDFDVDDDFDHNTPWEKEFDMALPDHLHEPLAARITKKRNEEMTNKRAKEKEQEETAKYRAERKKRFWSRSKRKTPKKNDP